MNYKDEDQNDLEIDSEEVSQETSEDTDIQTPNYPTPEDTPPSRKVIQISFENGEEPSINYTADLTLSEVVGALEISKEMLISAKVLDKLRKRRLMQAYQDV